MAAHPDREALVEVASGRRWTWAELDADVNRLARGLIAAGVGKGDRVGIWSPNCAAWTLTQYATAKIGAVLVNVNPAYRTHEFGYAVNQSGLSVLISASSFKTSDYRAMVDEVRDECGSMDRVVYLDTEDWAMLLSEGDELPEDAVAERMATLDPSDPINIQYTSGTTGRPKGATLSHRNILNNGFFTTELINFTEQDRLCIPVPFYHCFGMVMGNLGCTTHGATMVIPAPGFDPEITLRTIAEERCTGVYGVPTMFIAMQNHPTFADHDLSSLRTGVMAGSICPVEVMKHCVEDMHMAEVSICYGMTETSPVSTQTRTDDDLDRRTATIGRVHPHVEIKVVDPATGETVERGDDRGALHPRLLRDAGLLGRAGEDRRGHRRRRLDAHRRPRRDARGRLLQHRRPDQGHGHPRRRERVPPRDRGVPLPAPRHRGRAGDRGPGRAVRRGAVRLGQDEGRRRARSTPTRSARTRRASSRTTRSRATSWSSTSSR